jgi:hypothetical protein
MPARFVSSRRRHARAPWSRTVRMRSPSRCSPTSKNISDERRSYFSEPSIQQPHTSFKEARSKEDLVVGTNVTFHVRTRLIETAKKAGECSAHRMMDVCALGLLSGQAIIEIECLLSASQHIEDIGFLFVTCVLLRQFDGSVASGESVFAVLGQTICGRAGAICRPDGTLPQWPHHRGKATSGQHVGKKAVIGCGKDVLQVEW